MTAQPTETHGTGRPGSRIRCRIRMRLRQWDGSHGLTDESMSHAYTALLCNWMREMLFDAQSAG